MTILHFFINKIKNCGFREIIFDKTHYKVLVYQLNFRCKNHEELMETLKEVNQIIQQSARLRIGKSKVLNSI